MKPRVFLAGPTEPQTDMLAQCLVEARACRMCEAHLPLGPRPVVQAASGARVLLVGQAPGTRVHETGVPWSDASGDRLRAWLGVSRETFYDGDRFALVPMGFCYPGRRGSGDAPPRPECAPLWHPRLLALLPEVRVTLLLGAYAQARYLGARRKATLTETVRAYREYLPAMMPLPHPSPRNVGWRKSNPWFEAECVPALAALLRETLVA